MALNTEIILTLQQLKEVGKKGFGTKTILDIAKVPYDVYTLNDLCSIWQSLKGKKFQVVEQPDLIAANRLARDIIRSCQEEKIGIISYFEKEFPNNLRHCLNEEGKEDPSILLYYRGDLSTLQRPGIAIIGTREPTENGIKAGNFFASKFADKGFNIVSGLAIGCDTTGHIGALSITEGKTTAFLANGLDWASIYPKENLNLAKNIVSHNGLLLSEYGLGQRCNRYSLVARDRLQAGLAYATICIQTGINGGTMHAVNATLQAHKPLFAVRYKNADDNSHEKAQGNIRLLTEGKAIPLGTENLLNAIETIQESIAEAIRPKFKDELF